MGKKCTVSTDKDIDLLYLFLHLLIPFLDFRVFLNHPQPKSNQ